VSKIKGTDNPKTISYYEAISIAQRQAMRDIEEEGEFQNPYCPDSDSVSYHAYDAFEAIWDLDVVSLTTYEESK